MALTNEAEIGIGTGIIKRMLDCLTSESKGGFFVNKKTKLKAQTATSSNHYG